MDLKQRADRLATLLEERLDIRGQGLAAKHRRAGRRLPKWVAREIDYLLEALDLAEHPKLGRQIDQARLDAGYRKAEGWLKSVDPWDRRRGIAVNWLAVNSVNILIVLGLFVAVLFWRGFV